MLNRFFIIVPVSEEVQPKQPFSLELRRIQNFRPHTTDCGGSRQLWAQTNEDIFKDIL